MSATSVPDITVSMHQQLIHNQTSTHLLEVRDPVSLHQRFEHQAAQNPGAIAVTFNQQSFTYAELNREANRLAHHLINLGVQTNSLVGLSVERSLDIPIGILGILKAGGAYVPIDPAAPADRQKFIAEDAKLDLIVGRDAANVVDLATLPGDLRDDNPATASFPDDLAYIIYTSGSTGKPKGVRVSHRNVFRLLSQTENWYEFSQNDVWSLFHSYAFDVSVYELWGALLYGGRVVIVPYLVSRAPEQFRQLVINEQVTMLSQTPSAFRQFIDADMRSTPANYALRFVIFAGEALPLRMLAPWEARYGDDAPQLINMYGITETTVHAMFRRIVSAEIHDDPGSMIGVPIPDLQIHVLDENQQPVAEGEIGEIYVGGPGVTQGYHNRPELTAERFLNLPEIDPGTIYKSGDLVRRISDSELEYIGRNDFQVQLRGFRVELGEIEAVLDTHPNVHASIVQLRNHNGNDRLVAWIVPGQGCQSIAWGDLRKFAETKLPDYMVPSAVAHIETIPLNLNGKRDLKALPEMGQQRPNLGHSAVAARDDLETFLTTLWREVLNLDEVGVTDRFFELGGSSMQAAQFVNRVVDALGEFIYVVTIFEAPTIAEYAALLRRDYGAAVARKFDHTAQTETAPIERKPISKATLAKMRRYIPTLTPPAPGNSAETSPNPSAIFILAPPRSGTTLLRIMLAGHPELFSSAELLLLNWQTLTERKAAYSDRHTLWQEGVIRAIMDIRNCDADAAFAVMAEYEARGWDTQTFYKELQSWVAPRTLVEKSPAYALDLGAMRRAEQIFDAPRYIHLVRRPEGMIRSFVKNHLAQVLFLKDHGFDDQTLGELIWTISHQTINTFLKDVPAERQVRVHFEELVSAPEQTMRTLCQGINIPYHEGLIQPYEKSETKMVDGIHRDSVPMGDTHFFEHGRIDPDVANQWRNDSSSGQISAITQAIADELA